MDIATGYTIAFTGGSLILGSVGLLLFVLFFGRNKSSNSEKTEAKKTTSQDLVDSARDLYDLKLAVYRIAQDQGGKIKGSDGATSYDPVDIEARIEALRVHYSDNKLIIGPTSKHIQTGGESYEQAQKLYDLTRKHLNDLETDQRYKVDDPFTKLTRQFNIRGKAKEIILGEVEYNKKLKREASQR